MVRLLIRFLRRLLVLALGIVGVWLIVFVVFDFADQRLPWIVALAVTYAIAAYIILPRLVRMSLKILQRKHVPRYTITGDGLPGDPVNVVLIGTLKQLHAAFAIAGWSVADRLGMASSWAWSGRFYSIRLIPPLRSVRFTFSGGARMLVSRKRLATVQGSVITSGFGR